MTVIADLVVIIAGNLYDAATMDIDLGVSEHLTAGGSRHLRKSERELSGRNSPSINIWSCKAIQSPGTPAVHTIEQQSSANRNQLAILVSSTTKQVFGQYHVDHVHCSRTARTRLIHV